MSFGDVISRKGIPRMRATCRARIADRSRTLTDIQVQRLAALVEEKGRDVVW